MSSLSRKLMRRFLPSTSRIKIDITYIFAGDDKSWFESTRCHHFNRRRAESMKGALLMFTVLAEPNLPIYMRLSEFQTQS
jgi:hypothetical protein